MKPDEFYADTNITQLSLFSSFKKMQISSREAKRRPNIAQVVLSSEQKI